MPVISQSNFAPSVTEVSTPSQMMPPRPVVRPLWNSATVTRAKPPLAGSVWHTWQLAVSGSGISRWNGWVVKSQLAIEPWQVKQPGPETGIAFAAASADPPVAGTIVLSLWQTLQFVM